MYTIEKQIADKWHFEAYEYELEIAIAKCNELFEASPGRYRVFSTRTKKNVYNVTNDF